MKNEMFENEVMSSNTGEEDRIGAVGPAADAAASLLNGADNVGVEKGNAGVG